MTSSLSKLSPDRISRAVALRRQLHASPELSFAENDTSGLVARRLDEMGYHVTSGVAGTGVVADIKGRNPGGMIALRADMDALPIAEQTGVSHASRVRGVMHACGHDGHTAALLLAAESIATQRERLERGVRLIFQPGEEQGVGAKRMIEEGVLEGVDKIYGFHNRPGFPAGEVFIKPGAAMAGCSIHDISLRGKGGHAAMPHLACDPVIAGARIAEALQHVRAARMSPLEPGVVTVTSFIAEAGANIIADSASLVTCSRYFSEECGEAIGASIGRIARGVADAHDVSAEVRQRIRLAPLINPPHVAQETAVIAAREFCMQRLPLIDAIPTLGSEDFAFFLRERPGCFFFVGNGVDSAYLHSPHYDFNDAVLPAAARMFLAIVFA